MEEWTNYTTGEMLYIGQDFNLTDSTGAYHMAQSCMIKYEFTVTNVRFDHKIYITATPSAWDGAWYFPSFKKQILSIIML
jgi:hypothetical protein